MDFMIRTKFSLIFFIFLVANGAFSVFGANPKPILTLRAEPEFFSPNNDGLEDQAFLYPVLQTASEAKNWRLDINAPGGKRIVRLSGPGMPSLIKWDGFDKRGLVVPDANYIAELSVKGSGFDLSTRYQVTVDTKKPEVKLEVSTPVVDGNFLQTGLLEFKPVAWDASPIDKWQVQVIDASGRTLQVMWSSGPVKNVSWNGTDRATGVMAPPGKYRSALVVWDKAGNESEPAFADFKINTTVRDMLQQNLQQLQIIETPIGLIVQLPSEKLFNLKMKKPRLTAQGKSLLREVGILVNAYPEVPVTIEGYSKTKKGNAVDRDKASFYGWNVYSYLVKAGHVMPSRLSVRGRGRSALFSRRGVAVPFIRNGVEVTLEGEREW